MHSSLLLSAERGSLWFSRVEMFPLPTVALRDVGTHLCVNPPSPGTCVWKISTGEHICSLEGISSSVVDVKLLKMKTDGKPVCFLLPMVATFLQEKAQAQALYMLSQVATMCVM